MQKLGINISDHPKIVIKSAEVYLGITRKHAQVGHKNINIFNHKNHLVRFCMIGKDLLHNFVQFLAQELLIAAHTTYPKIGTEDL
jgi:hypothetical protein